MTKSVFIHLLFIILNVQFLFSQEIEVAFGKNSKAEIKDQNSHFLINIFVVGDDLYQIGGFQDANTGVYGIELYRYSLDGKLDSTWQNKGKLIIALDNFKNCIPRSAILSNQQIIVASEAFDVVSDQRSMAFSTIHVDGSAQHVYHQLHGVVQNNIVQLTKTENAFFIAGNTFLTYDLETNKYPFVLKLKEDFSRDSSFHKTGVLILDDYRGNTTARILHTEGGEAENISINNKDEILLSGAKLSDEKNTEFLCKINQSGEFIVEGSFDPYVEFNSMSNFEVQNSILYSLHDTTYIFYTNSQNEGMNTYYSTLNSFGDEILHQNIVFQDQENTFISVQEKDGIITILGKGTMSSENKSFIHLTFVNSKTQSSLNSSIEITTQDLFELVDFTMKDNFVYVAGYEQTSKFDPKSSFVYKIDISELKIPIEDEIPLYHFFVQNNTEIIVPVELNTKTYSLYNLEGKKMDTGKCTNSISIEQLKAGIYILDINDKSQKSQYRFSKK